MDCAASRIDMKNVRIIALDLRPRKFGYVVLEGPARLVDCGVKRFQSTLQYVERIQNLIKTFQPSVIVVRRMRKGSQRDCPALRRVYRRIGQSVRSNHFPIIRVNDAAIRRTLHDCAKPTKEKMARMIGGLFPELLWHVPPPRRPWQPEHSRMPLFDAAALGMTYFALKIETDNEIG
jgi:hypothetical protein